MTTRDRGWTPVAAHLAGAEINGLAGACVDITDIADGKNAELAAVLIQPLSNEFAV